MDFGVVVIIGVMLIGGFAVGMLASVALPRDDEAASMHRELARRALSRLPGALGSDPVRLQPKPDPGI